MMEVEEKGCCCCCLVFLLGFFGDFLPSSFSCLGFCVVA